MPALFKMSPRPGVELTKDLKLTPREGVVYRTPTGRLAVLSQRKQKDLNSFHFTYVGKDPQELRQDGVGRARAYTGESQESAMGVFALSPANVGYLRMVGFAKAGA